MSAAVPSLPVPSLTDASVPVPGASPRAARGTRGDWIAPDPNARRALGLVAALAAILVRPLDHLHPDRLRPAATGFAPFDGPVLRRMAAGPAFRGPVNRAVARALGLPGITPAPDLVERLTLRPATRLAVLLLVRPLDELQAAGRLVAAAVLHRRVVGLVLRSEREAARAALGEAGFRLALDEAPLLHAPLAALAEGEALAARGAQGGEADGAAGEAVDRLARGVLGRLVAAETPDLHPLFATRFPAGAVPEPPSPARGLDETARAHLVRLLRRRFDTWSPLIG